jgi:putative ABC transport system substrate-binding protein
VKPVLRTLLALAFGLIQSVAQSQQAGKTPRVGVLSPGSSKEPISIQREPFERGLRELGWIPASSVLIDYRYGEGSSARIKEMATDLARSGVDVIVARGVPAIHAARQAAPGIPIVMSAGEDPVAEGLVQNLSRPGGNITGLTVLAFDLDGKRLELLKESFPGIRRVAVITNPAFEPASFGNRIAALHASARSLNIDLEVFEVRRAAEIAGVSAAVRRGKFDALMIRPDPHVIDPHRKELVAIAEQLRLPAIYPWRFFVEAGGLMSYGTSIAAFHHRSATYVSRILKGAKPGDLAIEQPTTFELVVNVAAAKTQGLALPQALIFRADQLIQ